VDVTVTATVTVRPNPFQPPPARQTIRTNVILSGNGVEAPLSADKVVTTNGQTPVTITFDTFRTEPWWGFGNYQIYAVVYTDSDPYSLFAVAYSEPIKVGNVPCNLVVGKPTTPLPYFAQCDAPLLIAKPATANACAPNEVVLVSPFYSDIQWYVAPQGAGGAVVRLPSVDAVAHGANEAVFRLLHPTTNYNGDFFYVYNSRAQCGMRTSSRVNVTTRALNPRPPVIKAGAATWTTSVATCPGVVNKVALTGAPARAGAALRWFARRSLSTWPVGGTQKWTSATEQIGTGATAEVTAGTYYVEEAQPNGCFTPSADFEVTIDSSKCPP